MLATPTPTPPTPASERPLASEVDVFGVTHPGHVRRSNADHFLVASFHRQMRVHVSSLAVEFPPTAAYSRGYLMLVADGVGSLAHAADGSERAIETVARYLLEMSEISLQTDPSREGELVDRLRTAFVRAHEALLSQGEEIVRGTNATTLTMLISCWPKMFVLHVGDSRCYRLRGDVLQRLTIDQTMAQVMLDAGALAPGSAEISRLKHVLVSAVGSSQMEPQLTVTDVERTDRTLLCSDGLTRHVSDDEIHAHMAKRGSTESVCRELVDLALERGGEDNITVVFAKVRDV